MMNSESSLKMKDKRVKLVKEFDELLDSIDSASFKEKILWKQIYNNALEDRNNAHLCFMSLYPTVSSDTEAHVLMGDKLAKYMERMEKANEQLIKLSALVRKALESQPQEATFDSDQLLDEIQTQAQNKTGDTEH